MEPLGTFRALEAEARYAGTAVLIVAVGLSVWLQRLQLRLKRAESSAWWASNGRDLINGLALAGVVAALWGIGYPGPSALLVGASALLLINFVESRILLWKLSAPTALSIVIALLLVLPVMLAPERVHAFASRVAAGVLG